MSAAVLIAEQRLPGSWRQRAAAILTVAVLAIAGAILPAASASAASGTLTLISNDFAQNPGFRIQATGLYYQNSLVLRGTGPSGEVIEKMVSESAPDGTFETYFPTSTGGTWRVEAVAVPRNGAASSVFATTYVTTAGYYPSWSKGADGRITAVYPYPSTTRLGVGMSYTLTLVPVDPTQQVISLSTSGTAAKTQTFGNAYTVPGVLYRVYVGYLTAVPEVTAGTIQGPSMMTSAQLFYIGAPAPSGVAATAGNASATVTWQAVSAPSDAVYRVKYKRSADATWSTFVDTTAVSSTVTGLTNGTSYDFSVTTLDAGAEGGTSSVVSATPTSPPAQAVIQSVTVADSAIRPNVSFPSSAGAPSAANDAVWQVTNISTGAVTTVAPQSLGNNDYLISGLTNGVDYSLSVTARNARGSAAPATGGPYRPVGMPGAPVLDAPRVFDGGLSVAATVSNTAANPALFVIWEKGVAVNGTVTNWQSVTPTVVDGRFTFTGLTNGTDYRVRAYANNQLGNSAWAESAVARPIAAPAVPSISSIAAGDGLVTVTANVPNSDSRPVVSTQWQITEAGAANWRTVTATGTGPYVIAGLVNGTDYEVRVRTSNGQGTTNWSNVSAVARPITVPAAPALSNPTAGQASASVTGVFTSTDAAPASGREWQVGEVVNGVVANWITSTPSASGSVYTFSGLTNGTEYRIRARSLAPQGNGSWAETVTSVVPYTTPAQPNIVNVAPADESIVVDATFPTSAAQPSAAADAQWQVSDDNGISWRNVLVTGSGSVTITGLTNGTSYRVRVRAGNAMGYSDDWATSGSVRPVTTPALPELKTPVQGNTSFIIEAEFPSSDAAPSSGHEWQIGEVVNDAVASWSTVTPAVLASGEYRFSGLANGTEYRVQARATGSGGNSAWVQSAGVVPIDVPGAPSLGQPVIGNGELRILTTFPSTTAAPSVAWMRSGRSVQ